MIAAVIFDFDGVLADSEHLHLEAFQRVFNERGWTLTEGDYFSTYLGYDDRDLIAAYAANHQLNVDRTSLDAIAEEKRLAFAAFLDTRGLLYPGARQTVETLATRYPLAIASGALHAEIEAVLKQGDILSAFPVIVGADDVAASKPAPDTYLAAARGLGVPPADCIAIEDSQWGLDAARSAGMRTIGVTTTSRAESLRAADVILGNVTNVTLDVIEALDRKFTL